MAEKKRKKMNDNNRQRKKSKVERKKTGPRLPSSLKKEIECLNPTDVDFDEIHDDVYEYEEQQAEEESKKNNRYDPVSVKDDLPSDFEDEQVQSEDDDDYGYIGTNRDGNAHTDDSGKEDKGRHVRMLQEITGMPSEAFEENKKMTMKVAVRPELYPEFEFNPTRDVVDGHGHINIEDLLNPLRDDPNYAKLRKRAQQIEKNGRTICAPLPEADQSKVDRKAAYQISKKNITKWQPIIQRNRQASTMFFGEKVDLGCSTIGALTSAFEPRNEFERKISALVNNEKLVEAHKGDGSKLLKTNKVSMDENDGQNPSAKMRSRSLCHEKKAKRTKNIKSKTYRQSLKKDRLKSESSRIEMDPEAAKEYAMKQLFWRAEERMTLRYTNRNPWANHAKQHGLDCRFEGIRAAMDEHHRRHNESTRKIPYMMGSSSNSNSDEDSDENSAGSDHDRQDIKHAEKVLKEGSDTESEGHMVDGILTSTSESPYELPSQEELIRQAFAGDDVEDDFEKDKQEILNEENPEPEKPILLPGWGQWTHTQQKKGLPSWMLKKYEGDLKKRDEALNKRIDAHLKNVIISEKLNKKAEKLYTKVLAYPFTSKDVFEQSMRMPIGPESNPTSAIGPLNRPQVVRRPGSIIKPIEFEV